MTKKEQLLAIENEIISLKYKLKMSDYKAIKFFEGEITEAEYAETRTQRRAWRAEVNALETKLATLK